MFRHFHGDDHSAYIMAYLMDTLIEEEDLIEIDDDALNGRR